ncbi:MAG: hypothetical protein ACXQTA_00085 [Candidatus Syntropharchaeales archaeon]
MSEGNNGRGTKKHFNWEARWIKYWSDQPSISISEGRIDMKMYDMMNQLYDIISRLDSLYVNKGKNISYPPLENAISSLEGVVTELEKKTIKERIEQ